MYVGFLVLCLAHGKNSNKSLLLYNWTFFFLSACLGSEIVRVQGHDAIFQNERIVFPDM